MSTIVECLFFVLWNVYELAVCSLLAPLFGTVEWTHFYRQDCRHRTSQWKSDSGEKNHGTRHWNEKLGIPSGKSCECCCLVRTLLQCDLTCSFVLKSPAIGGLLADPVAQYPHAAAWMHQSYMSRILTKYRFLLPNLVACVGCFVAFLIVKFFVDETLPESKRRHAGNIPRDVLEWVQAKARPYLSRKQYGETQHLFPNKNDASSSVDAQSEPNVEQLSIWGRVVTRRHLVVHWMYSFVSMCADEMFPLFCMSQSGLGLAEASIGKILSGAGLLFAISQYAVFSTLVHYFGEYTCLTVGSILGIQPATLIPLSLLLSTTSLHLSWSVFSLLSVVMAVCKLFGMLYFASLALALNKTVPTSQRGTMNGLVVTGASMARCVAPTFAGALTTFSFSSWTFPAQYGSLLMYGTLSLLGACVTVRVQRLKEIRDKESTVEMEEVDESRI